MFNLKQANRLSHPDFKLQELTSEDLIDLGFMEYKNRKQNSVFTRRKIKLERISDHCFITMINEKEIRINRWWHLVQLWTELNDDCIFRM